ncbi:MAG: hypothetical protein C0410_11325 [Anaerolinea sp.]|nr:hypothetical protein [Anaerolinea sp.]
MYWKSGESCVLRGIVNSQVWLAQSVIVVEDKPELTILVLLPGAQCATPEGVWRRESDKEYAHSSRWQSAPGEHFYLQEYIWKTNRVLIFLEPQKYYSCMLFWEHQSDQFAGYYINFQLPYKRSHCGFDTLDLDLDIVIDPQYNWQWKDMDAYEHGIQEGGIHVEWVRGIEKVKPEVFKRIDERSYPMDGSWVNWEPDPIWSPPELPKNWNKNIA